MHCRLQQQRKSSIWRSFYVKAEVAQQIQALAATKIKVFNNRLTETRHKQKFHQPPHKSSVSLNPQQLHTAHNGLASNAVWPEKTVFINAISNQKLSYRELTTPAQQFANSLRGQGFAPENRVLVDVLDTPDWPVVLPGLHLGGRGASCS